MKSLSLVPGLNTVLFAVATTFIITAAPPLGLQKELGETLELRAAFPDF